MHGGPPSEIFILLRVVEVHTISFRRRPDRIALPKEAIFYPNLYHYFIYKFFSHYIVEQWTYSRGIYYEKKYDFGFIF